jgi:hypothetical protein
VRRRVATPRDNELQNSRHAVGAQRFGHERLGRMRIRAAYGDAPVQFEAPNEQR